MARIQLAELTALSAVAEHRSFTKAAALVGVALPTMSQTIRSLEERLGVRLFNRTTRSVELTEAGAKLLSEVQPILDSVDHALESVNMFRDKPMGTLRLVISRPASWILRAHRPTPIIKPFLEQYPSILLEAVIDDSPGDIVARHFDAGIRLGHRIERDMTALRLLDEFRMLTVAAPDYLAQRQLPSVPKDLQAHNCVRYRYPGDNSISHWSFKKGSKQIEIAVDGSFIVNDLDSMLSATLEGVGIGLFPEPIVESHIAEGRLISVLEDWSTVLPGVFLYHSSRRQTPMPLRVFIDFMEKWRKETHLADSAARSGAKSRHSS